MIAKHDDDPERFYISLWSYKWVCAALPRMASVSLEQINSVLDDFERRLRADGSPVAPSVKLRMESAILCGDLDRGAELFNEWMLFDRRSRQQLNDCWACDLSTEVFVLLVLCYFEEALHAGRPLIDGRAVCGDQPGLSLGDLALCAFETGQLELASELHDQCYAIIRDSPMFVTPLSRLITLSSITGQADRALSLASEHRHWMNEPQSDLERLRFGRAVGLALDAANAEGMSTESDDQGSVAELVSYADTAEQIAQRFDQRNGNDYYVGPS
jgi:hypothetical protein